jgi:hypothetical protein
VAALEPLLLPIFGFPHKKMRKYKKYISKSYSEEIQKIIGARKGCWNTHKMARNWLRRFKNTRIKI